MGIERDDYGLGTVIMTQSERGAFLCVNMLGRNAGLFLGKIEEARL